MATKFNWEDPFFMSEQLSDDERAIVDAAHNFCQEKLQTRVLMAARHEKFDREIMNEAGAMGFLSKLTPGSEIARAIRRVMDGHKHISPDLAESLIGNGRPSAIAFLKWNPPPFSICQCMPVDVSS